jgi:hypothetical protein
MLTVTMQATVAVIHRMISVMSASEPKTSLQAKNRQISVPQRQRIFKKRLRNRKARTRHKKAATSIVMIKGRESSSVGRERGSWIRDAI